MIKAEEMLPVLPGNWAWCKLGDILCDSSTLIAPNKKPSEMFELYSVPIYEIGRPEIISGKQIGSNKQIVEKDTVLLCKINPRINRVWVVGDYSPYKKIASTEWIPFFKREEVDPKYLCYYMRTNSFRDYLASNVSGVGGSLMRIKAFTFADYPFPLSPISEQKRIVSKIDNIFSCLDASVQALKLGREQIKRYRQSVLKAAVEGKLSKDWRDSNEDEIEPILIQNKDNQKIILENSLYELPKDWIWTTMGEIISEIKAGKSFKCEERPPEIDEIGVVKVSGV
jgi:type I restriction enzyme S subunit